MKIRTKATPSVAMILANVGEKKTEIIPSLMPINSAATTVPGRLPSPPMMTTMKLLMMLMVMIMMSLHVMMMMVIHVMTAHRDLILQVL